MNRSQRPGARGRAALAATLLAGLPVTAFLVAPAARAVAGTPGENLAGISADSSATAIQFVPLATGVVPAGNLATGDFVQVSIPYSSSSTSTGPSNATTATPVWPGPVAANLSSALPELGFPASLAPLFVDPVLAQADYPAQVSAGPSGSYAPPGGSTTGAGTANANATDGGTNGVANLSNTPIAGGVIQIGSSTATSSITIGASSVADAAHADLSHISILSGLIDIASVSSDATSTSNGSLGTETSALKVGSVTLLDKYPAYIGPDGLQLVSTDENSLPAVALLNSALTALKQAGLSISAIAPTDQVQGAASSVDSGALRIAFLDSSLPSLQGNNPITSAGLDIDLGLTHADADATLLPPLGSLPPPPTQVTVPTGTSPAVPSGTVPDFSGGGTSSVLQTSSSTPSAILSAPPQTAPLARPATPTPVQPSTIQPAAFLGMPTRMAWVVIAILLSIVASGPLLGYANWQLLRGRNP